MNKLLDKIEDIELSQEELSKLTTDSGESINDEGALESAQAVMSPEMKQRSRSFNTGHKLKILAELQAGRDVDEICLQHRITRTALAVIATDTALMEAASSAYISETKKHMAARFYQLADLCLSHIDPKKLERLDPYKLGVLASIALDKARLIEGQSTENLSFKSLALNIHANLQDLKTRRSHLEELLKKRKNLAGVIDVPVESSPE